MNIKMICLVCLERDTIQDLDVFQIIYAGLKTHYLTLGFNVIFSIDIQYMIERVTSHL